MKNIDFFSQKEQTELRRLLEKCCEVVLPQDETRFGRLRFQLFRDQRQNGLYFLINWGMQKIFSARGIRDAEHARLLKQLHTLICGNKTTIKKALNDYYGEQLNNLAQIELYAELAVQCNDAGQLNIKVCHGRSCRLKDRNTLGWPNFCVAISWLDEYDDFQEFLFPLPVDEQSKSFIIASEKIIAQFQSYRQQIL